MSYFVAISQGKTLIDRQDLKWFKLYNFQVEESESGKLYVRATNGGRPYLHRLILGAQKGFFVDHINGDGLDNRRVNLRICSLAENNKNLSKYTGEKITSKYKGVSLLPNGKWRCRVQGEHVGNFDTEELAALAYNERALKLFGDFAKLNEVKK